ncbi:aspartate/glutamate racemase family protein [Segnochrobactraceae bacterium EtOH-i3]
MKRIGLIGGMSWESTVTYYRLLNEAVRDQVGGLASADVLLHSLNFADVVALQKAGRWDLAGEMLGRAGAGLAGAGADCVLICTNTMHLVSETVEKMAGVPLIHIIDETAKALIADGRRKPLLLATRYTMEHGFYAERMARHGLAMTVPGAEDRGTVHDVIFDELCRGEIRADSRARFLAIIDRAVASGVDSVILGCTEISLLIDPDQLPLPGYDSTAIHAAAAVRFALDRAEAGRQAA